MSCANLSVQGLPRPTIVAARMVVTVLRSSIAGLGLIAAAFLVSGCQNIFGGTPPTTSGFEPHVDVRQQEIDERKEEIVRQLAHCESGGWGPSDQPIHGGRGAYLGRLQFSVGAAVPSQNRPDAPPPSPPHT